MRRRHLIVALSAGLLACTTPACTPYRAGVAQSSTLPPPPQPVVAQAPPSDPPVAASPVPEPHRVTRTTSSDQPPPETPIEQTRFPGEPEKQEATTQPAPLLEPPGPTRDPSQPEPVPVSTLSPETQQTVEEPLLTALRCFLCDQPAEALTFIEQYDKSNQELLLVLLPLAARLGQVKLHELTDQEASALLNQLNGAIVPLRSLAALSIDKMCFCRSIDKFGVFEPLPDNHAFRPGEPVQVYVEIQNFTTAVQDKHFVTSLASSVAICEYNGKVVWHKEFSDQEYTELSLSERHDYFSNYTLCIPEDAAPGAYTLRIRVTDAPTKRSVERTLDFRVTTAPARPS